MQIDFPWQYDLSGGTATTDWPNHVRDLLVQFLFTHPGERVNRPDFGAGLYRLCFEGNSSRLSNAMEFILQAGLQRWFGEQVEVSGIEVRGVEAALLVELIYRITGEDCQRRIEVTPQGVR